MDNLKEQLFEKLSIYYICIFRIEQFFNAGYFGQGCLQLRASVLESMEDEN